MWAAKPKILKDVLENLLTLLRSHRLDVVILFRVRCRKSKAGRAEVSSFSIDLTTAERREF